MFLPFRIENRPLPHEHIDFQIEPLVHDEILIRQEMDGPGSADEPHHGAAFHDAFINGVPELSVLIHIGPEEGKHHGPENNVMVKETGPRRR